MKLAAVCMENLSYMKCKNLFLLPLAYCKEFLVKNKQNKNRKINGILLGNFK